MSFSNRVLMELPEDIKEKEQEVPPSLQLMISKQQTVVVVATHLLAEFMPPKKKRNYENA